MDRRLTFLGAGAALIAASIALGPTPESRVHEPIPAVGAPHEAGVLIVDLVDGASEADLAEVEALLATDLDWTHPLARDEALALGEVADLAGALEVLRRHPLVEVAEPELMMQAHGWPNDPMYDRQWNLRAMGAPGAWASSQLGEGVVVAVVDTGVTQVEDLKGTAVLTGQTFVPGTETSADDQGHGTHVAGTIAQTTHNGVGVAGVAPNASILPVKVLSKQGFGSSAWIAAGIDYAVDEGADVINLSLGGSYSLVIHHAIRKAKAKGVVVVASAGNSGRRGVGYPGALTETIGVSATGPDGQLAPYSSYGKGVDIAAPGGDKRKAGGGILQDTVDGRGGHHYVEYQGTSMAAPHVSGAAALLLGNGLPGPEVERMLLKTARGDAWSEQFGHGHLDVSGALQVTTAQHSATRFALAAAGAWLITGLAGGAAGFRLACCLWSGFAAGGLFFLSFVPVPRAGWFGWLTTGVVEWPALLIGPDWVHFPLWTSALLPLGVALVPGAFRPLRALAIGICVGFGATLMHGAITGALEPWWLPTSLGGVWLVVNGTVCVLLAMALAGAQKLEEGLS